jgi:hypothetical protein
MTIVANELKLQNTLSKVVRLSSRDLKWNNLWSRKVKAHKGVIFFGISGGHNSVK